MTVQGAPTDSLSRMRERAGVRARSLRRSSTDAERAMWRALRNRGLGGYKFRRQHPIGPFFADFACIEANVIVEIDGSQHFDAAMVEADRRRTDALQRFGFTVLRFDNRQVLTECAAVLDTVYQWLRSNHPHPNPLPPAGEGAKTQESST
jgi:very-short-patch-repair endonuclease